MNYILKNKTPVLEPNIMQWAKWFEESKTERQVCSTNLPNGVYVSTIFLSIDHSFINNEKPILFETMIFGGEHDGFQERYCTWDEAEEGHKQAIKLTFEVLNP